MHTTSAFALTQSISIAAPPQDVFELVADPYALPRWAPGFARTVRPDGDHWIIENDQGETRMTVRASRDHGTVDLLSAEDPRQGAFTRVLPNGEGSEYQFTLLLPAELADEAVAQQLTIVESELQAVRTLCE